jgi:hypothetical protein
MALASSTAFSFTWNYMGYYLCTSNSLWSSVDKFLWPLPSDMVTDVWAKWGHKEVKSEEPVPCYSTVNTRLLMN